jgi:2,3-bisphosphoglycerate-independent phosphoglycerate mutase
MTGPTGTPPVPLVLIVLDGWGIRPEREYNAIALARTPTWDELLARFPHTTLEASGEDVGLPDRQMGNSEVGHMNMGAGRIVYQDLTRIDRSIDDGEFFANPVLQAAMTRCMTANRALHLMGLASDGGVHSHQRHLHALLELAARLKVPRVFVHAFTDGRDCSPTGGRGYLRELEKVMDRLGTGRIATVTGRYYAMDRDRRWDRTRRAWAAIVLGEGKRAASVQPILEASYAAGVTDEFLEPVVVTGPDGGPVATLRDDDSAIFFNFRADRARQLTRALALDTFDGFERPVFPRIWMSTMTMYDSTFGLPVALEPQVFSCSLAEVLAGREIGNLRLAETEKYAHVTYFFNCGIEQPYEGEDRILVPSQKVATYDLKPEMSAPAITEQLLADLDARHHRVIICNFANADMVGHTGNLEAAIAAVETLDGCLARILPAIDRAGGSLIVTADHGNAEQMWDTQTGGPHTAHTNNPVPLVLIDHHSRTTHSRRLRPGGSLRDVAPTMLALLGIDWPKEMTGRDLRD